MEIRSDPAVLGEVRQKAECFMEEVGFSAECNARIVLAMDEALTNVIRHAYEGRTDERIEIDLCMKARTLRITIRDYGQVVHPSAIRSRDLEDVRPGGLGVHIMNECMDHVEFSPA